MNKRSLLEKLGPVSMRILIIALIPMIVAAFAVSSVSASDTTGESICTNSDGIWAGVSGSNTVGTCTFPANSSFAVSSCGADKDYVQTYTTPGSPDSAVCVALPSSGWGDNEASVTLSRQLRCEQTEGDWYWDENLVGCQRTLVDPPERQNSAIDGQAFTSNFNGGTVTWDPCKNKCHVSNQIFKKAANNMPSDPRLTLLASTYVKLSQNADDPGSQNICFSVPGGGGVFFIKQWVSNAWKNVTTSFGLQEGDSACWTFSGDGTFTFWHNRK